MTLAMLRFFLKEQLFLAGCILLFVRVGNLIFGSCFSGKLGGSFGNRLIHNRYICCLFGIRKRENLLEGNKAGLVFFYLREAFGYVFQNR